MGQYCITAVNHDNPSNHCASKFKVWEYYHNPEKEKWLWRSLGGKSVYYIADLIKNGHEVSTAKENKDRITLGKPVEIELRIAKNETDFKISDMPEF